jgi:hypothetical protein
MPPNFPQIDPTTMGALPHIPLGIFCIGARFEKIFLKE